MPDTTVIAFIVGLFGSWTITVAAFTYWLNNKMNALLSTADFRVQHVELEKRVRNLEIQIAIALPPERRPEYHLPK